MTSTANNGQSNMPPTNGVSVQVDRTSYQGSDAIQVTVYNNLSTPIYAHDTAASCSILVLQEQVNGTWQGASTAHCPLKRPAMIVKIDAGGTYTATITASYSGMPASAFPAGTYQLLLPYSTAADAIATGPNGHEVNSATFTVS